MKKNSDYALPPYKDSTKARRARGGWSGDVDLRRTGGLMRRLRLLKVQKLSTAKFLASIGWEKPEDALIVRSLARKDFYFFGWTRRQLTRLKNDALKRGILKN